MTVQSPVPQPQPSTTTDCAQAHELLFVIEKQKAAFDVALKEATRSGDFSAVESLGAELQKKVDELKTLIQEIEDKQDPEKAMQQKIEAKRQWVYSFEQENGLDHDPDRFLTFEVGGMSGKELIVAIESTPEAPGATRNMQISDTIKMMLEHTAEFIPTTEREQMYFIRLTVAELGFSNSATITEIFDKAQALGLRLCSSDAGPHLRLHLKNQPMDESLHIGMNPISFLYGSPRVFAARRNRKGAMLSDDWVAQGHRWNVRYRFVFRCPPSV